MSFLWNSFMLAEVSSTPCLWVLSTVQALKDHHLSLKETMLSVPSSGQSPMGNTYCIIVEIEWAKWNLQRGMYATWATSMPSTALESNSSQPSAILSSSEGTEFLYMEDLPHGINWTSNPNNQNHTLQVTMSHLANLCLDNNKEKYWKPQIIPQS